VAVGDEQATVIHRHSEPHWSVKFGSIEFSVPISRAAIAGDEVVVVRQRRQTAARGKSTDGSRRPLSTGGQNEPQYKSPGAAFHDVRHQKISNLSNPSSGFPETRRNAPSGARSRDLENSRCATL